MNKEIAQIRRSYMQSSLDIGDLDGDPIKAFDQWFKEAQKSDIKEPNVMTLATVDPNGLPAARIVLLKGIDERGFIFYTNYESQKGKDLEALPQACLVFFWQELERQVRIDGTVKKVPRAESEEYFHSRPRGSQIGAWTSPQSSPITSRDYLENRYRQLTEQFGEEEKIPLPDHWGGYVVEPFAIEFWQGRPSRLHDRILYRKNGKSWNVTRLAP